MAKSSCECGQAHAVAIYDGKGESHENDVPLEVHAFADCAEARDWLEKNVHRNMDVTVAGISTSVRHFQDWIDRFNDREV